MPFCGIIIIYDNLGLMFNEAKCSLLSFVSQVLTGYSSPYVTYIGILIGMLISSALSWLHHIAIKNNIPRV